MTPTTIRQMLAQDAKAMFQLHVAAIQAIDDSFYTKDIRDSWAFGLTPEGYVNAQNDGEDFEVAVNNAGQVIAFCGVKNGKVFSLFVHPHYQGLGIGKALYMRGEVRACTQNPTATVLPLSASLCAVSFYEHLGYEAIKRIEVKSRGGLMMLVSEMEKAL